MPESNSQSSSTNRVFEFFGGEKSCLKWILVNVLVINALNFHWMLTKEKAEASDDPWVCLVKVLVTIVLFVSLFTKDPQVLWLEVILSSVAAVLAVLYTVFRIISIIGHSGVTVGSIVYLTSTAVILTGGAFVLAAYLIRKIWENATGASIQERNK
ncbi:hypothetical protein WR25_26863 [Diploscapter pachys]|uniref:Uncharacterized protein n=1 Tax=Diploscapter pachys TaxID=2018661 RepID=A0A2A2KTU2_9BILA|nr:hypothetical protein WR25_26863 [Diploscapter pachys]